jgi:hypothetical protein
MGKFMETISYCERWVNRTRGSVDPLSPSVAEQRHREGMPYTAIISAGNVPRFVVEVARDSVGVYFLDEHQRPYLQYDFHEVTPGRLFMKRVIYREYDGSTDKIVEGQMFLFTPEGKQTNIVEDRIHHTSKQQEAVGVEVESNWEAYPAFGQYDSVCRSDRG